MEIKENVMPFIGKLYWSFISVLGPFIICTILSLISVFVANQKWLRREYNFTFNATDPEGNAVMYNVDWGDGNKEWTEYGNSGVEITLKHTWKSRGTFTIKAQAVDINGVESVWTDFQITIPKNKPFNSNFNFLNWIFERFPNAFPILRYILRP